MNQHNVCPTCSTVLANDPYRSNVIKAKIVTSSAFSQLIVVAKRYTNRLTAIKPLQKITAFIVNASVGFACIGAAYCIVVYGIGIGIYRLGWFVGADVFGWNMNCPDPADQLFARWFLGFACWVAIPVIGLGIPVIGRSVRSLFRNDR